MAKVTVGILFGGNSAEHEVSIVSASNVAKALNKKRYRVVPIYITRRGEWRVGAVASRVLKGGAAPSAASMRDSKVVSLVPGGRGLLAVMGEKRTLRIDVAFPVLHGPNGEDGSVQGALKTSQTPFVGAGVLGSAVGMDKDVMKRLLKEAGIPVTPFATVRKGERVSYTTCKKTLGPVLFVKPANLGSSVGVSKVSNEKTFRTAVRRAFQYDTKVLIEKAVRGRELECSVLGNDVPRASKVGEVAPTHVFYSYDAKYLDAEGAHLFVPARIPQAAANKVRELAIRTYRALTCEGMGRVDCFLTAGGKILVNEINTIPGFTSISMYPKLWEASGLSQEKLLDMLISLAFARARTERNLKNSGK